MVVSSYNLVPITTRCDSPLSGNIVVFTRYQYTMVVSEKELVTGLSKMCKVHIIKSLGPSKFYNKF